MAGVLPLERLHRFELVLWRSCHGKVFIKHTPIMTPLEDPSTVSTSHTNVCMYLRMAYLSIQGAMVQKTVFVLFFQGEQLRARVGKICEG